MRTCNGCVQEKEVTFHPYIHPYRNIVMGGYFCQECLGDFDVKRLIIATKKPHNYGRKKKSQGEGQQCLVLQ